MNDQHANLAECAAEAARVARGIRPDQLAGPTPASDWDVRTAVDHWVLYTSHGLEHRARRTTLPEELVSRDFAAEPDWAEAYAAQLDRAVAAWADPAAWVGEVDLGGTPMPAASIVEMIMMELALHGWDVARSTGQDYRISEKTGEDLVRIVGDFAEMFRQYDGFAAPVPLAAGASAFDRALALSGRDPRWVPGN
ncbi:MAG: TIGR03086 family metal-binding protein [Streptosporangiaceae bacterium]